MMEPGELIERLRDLSSLLRSAFIPTTAQDALVTDEAADALEAALLRISELEKIMRFYANHAEYHPAAINEAEPAKAVLSPLGGLAKETS